MVRGQLAPDGIERMRLDGRHAVVDFEGEVEGPAAGSQPEEAIRLHVPVADRECQLVFASEVFDRDAAGPDAEMEGRGPPGQRGA